MKKVFVTGADGLLGSNVVRELINRNYLVKVMIQPGHKAQTLEGLEIEKVEADLLDKTKVLQVSAGADIIIHIAAITNVWPSRGEIYHRVNVEGTKNMIAAALQHQVERMIHVGTASSFGFGSQEKPGTENDPCISAKYGLDYIDTKLEGERAVMEAVHNQGLNALIVNPTFMFGPYDSTPTSGAMILAALRGQVPGFSPGGKNWVAAKDVATAICNAITMGRIGERYILGGENLSYKDAMSQIFEVVGRKPPAFTFPAFLVKFVGAWNTLMSYFTQKPPKLSYPMARIACDGHYFSPDKAISELEMPKTPLKVAIKEALEWFNKNGYI